ncbi:transcriptional regulator, AraC family [Dyella jiangningensis]|nr:AraC family transcriptional regulator [Dyella sp. AtDHG13]SDL05598.1 transcriptional regulator, AraC family [Dyella jiangningensis]
MHRRVNFCRKWAKAVRNVRAEAYDQTPRDVIATGNEYVTHQVLPPHSHRRGQLLYASTGVLTTITSEGSWVVPPRRALWIPPGVMHEVHMTGPVATRSAYVTPEATLAAGLATHCQVIAVSPLLHELLMEAVDLPAEYALDGRDGRLMALLVDEIRRMPVLPLSAPLPHEKRLAMLCRQLLEQPSQEVKIDDMARQAGMSRRHFTRTFREETGMSFTAWRQQACLLSALTRLANGEAITQVAVDLGYGNPSAFTAAFRRVLGMAPSRYLASPAAGK